MKFHTEWSGREGLELPLVLAHFVPWYTIRGEEFRLREVDLAGMTAIPEIENKRHWVDGRDVYRRSHLHLPVGGIYDSRDANVISRQIETALNYGIDGFIVNWHGTNSVENVITLHWLKGLEKWNRANPDRPFCYFLSLDSQAQWATEGRVPVTMEEDFRYLKEHLIREAYLRHEDRPIFSVFAYENNCDQWRAAMDLVFGAEQVDLIWINSAPGKGENAVYPWVRPGEESVDSNHRWLNPDDAGDGFLKAFYANTNAGVNRPEYIMGGVWPGFDDQLVTWAWKDSKDYTVEMRPRVICRETSRGSTMALTWQAYLDYLKQWKSGVMPVEAPLVQVVTWNDYAEATTVEPSVDFGEKPLVLCAQYKKQARALYKT